MGHVHPTRDDRVVAALSEVVGGRVGQHATRHPWWTPARVLLLLTAVVFAIGMVQKAPCSLASDAGEGWAYSHMCYTDPQPAYVAGGYAELTWPWSDDEPTRERYEVIGYPPGIGYWAYGLAHVVHWASGSPDVTERYRMPLSQLAGDEAVDAETTRFVLLNAVGLAALALLVTWLLTRVNPGRPWDAAAFALSPTLALTGILNFDLLAAACVAGALWAWSRDRMLLVGALIGLGAAIKLYPVLLLVGVLALAVRRRALGDAATVVATAASTWLVVNLPAMLTGPDQWADFWVHHARREPELGSLWFVVDQAGDLGLASTTVNAWMGALLGLWCAGVVALALLARRGGAEPRLAQLAFLVVAGFVLIDKVYLPQHVLWLLPLAVLARPRWRDQLVWQSCEVLYFCSVWWYLGGNLTATGGGDPGFYWLAIVVRALGVLYLVAVVVRDVLDPASDPVPAQPSMTTRSNVVAV